MYKMKKVQTRKLTPAFAREVAAMPRWKGERPASEVRISYLRNELEAGTLYAPVWAIAVNAQDGVTYRVNGQHTSHVLSEASTNGHFPDDLQAVVYEFECENDNDLADLFSSFDHYKSTRTRQDTIRAHLRTHEELDDTSVTLASLAVNGIAYAMVGGNQSELRKMDHGARARLVHENADFIEWASDYLVQRKFGRAGVVAAMFNTYTKDLDSATEFWRWTKDEDHPTATHPTRRLAEFLKSYSLEQHGAGPGLKQFDARAFYVKCVHAWNAYRRGSSTDMKYHAKAPSPKVL